jgi:archaellum component FlaC
MKSICVFILIIFCLLPISAQKSNDRKIVDELKKITGQLNSIKHSNRELQKTVSSQKDQIEQLSRRLSETQGEIEKVAAASNSSITTVSTENGKINGRVDEIGNSIIWSKLLFALLISILAISGIAAFLYLLRRTPNMPKVTKPGVVETSSENDQEKMAEENTRDIEFLDVLTKTYSLLQERANSDSTVSEAVAHSLPLKVGDEIHRMRKRIENMPQEVKGLGALKNSLNRLEEEIKEAGYVMVDLLGRDYNEGIICEARFVENASVPPGREIITEVLKPQINHNGQVIQVAKIEVGKSYDVAK